MDPRIDVYDDFADEDASVPTPQKVLDYLDDKLLPKGYQFPYFMILSFTK